MTPDDQCEIEGAAGTKVEDGSTELHGNGVVMETYHAGQGGSETHGTGESRPRM